MLTAHTAALGSSGLASVEGAVAFATAGVEAPASEVPRAACKITVALVAGAALADPLAAEATLGAMAVTGVGLAAPRAAAAILMAMFAGVGSSTPNASAAVLSEVFAGAGPAGPRDIAALQRSADIRQVQAVPPHSAS